MIEQELRDETVEKLLTCVIAAIENAHTELVTATGTPDDIGRRIEVAVRLGRLVADVSQAARAVSTTDG
ncbi:MAG: hypothetical protein RLN87_04885 [Parasphingopyxis sp.]|uniref:hypothetical protein n=1 Tax=Parasphingopyxis sp. TaxID=1920299 RepID=UPI0032ECF917